MTTLYAIDSIPDYPGFAEKIEYTITRPLGRPLVSAKILGEDAYWTFFQSDENHIDKIVKRIQDEFGCTLNRIIPIVKSEIAKTETLLEISKNEWPILYFLFGTRMISDFAAIRGRIRGIDSEIRKEIVLAQITHPRYNFLATLSGCGMGEIATQLQEILNLTMPESFSMKLGAKHQWHGSKDDLREKRVESISKHWSEDPTANYIR